ncbi:MAG: hypothetical protein Q8R24_06560 [Legionellaceae bacterium]|nr:hypothetical protein [Legionellaceae bacterium]
MKKSLIVPTLLSSLLFSTGAFASTVTTTEYVDPVTGVVEGTSTVVSTVANGTLGYFPHANRYNQYIVTDLNTGMSKMVDSLGKNANDMMTDVASCNNPVFPGICTGTKYVLTDVNTGKKYSVIGVRQGTMDVMHGNKMTRYQYVLPLVKPL